VRYSYTTRRLRAPFFSSKCGRVRARPCEGYPLLALEAVCSFGMFFVQSPILECFSFKVNKSSKLDLTEVQRALRASRAQEQDPRWGCQDAYTYRKWRVHACGCGEYKVVDTTPVDALAVLAQDALSANAAARVWVRDGGMEIPGAGSHARSTEPATFLAVVPWRHARTSRQPSRLHGRVASWPFE